MRLMKRWKVVKTRYKFEKERLEKKWMMDRQRRVRLDRWKSRLIHRCSLKLQGWRVELSQLVNRIGKIEAAAAGSFVRKKWRLAKKVVGLSRGDFNRKKW